MRRDRRFRSRAGFFSRIGFLGRDIAYVSTWAIALAICVAIALALVLVALIVP